MHCHIAWHVGLGLAAQFVEQYDKILSTINLGPEFTTECNQWKQYYNTPPPYLQEDSGLRIRA